MTKRNTVILLTLLGLAGAAAAGEYDFYAGTKYPGATLRPDVEPYKVAQAGGADPKAYERREVVWWPRKGVDIIEVKKGMPLRTWTPRRGPIDPASDEGKEKPTVERWRKFESKQNVGDLFYRRIYGYLYPPKTGEYTFMISADDCGSLFLSSDQKPQNKRRIAGLSQYSRYKQFDRRAGQISRPIRLEAGKRYYIEASHEENIWGDHVEVAWEGPGITTQIINGEYLSGMDGKRGQIVVETTAVAASGQRRPFAAAKQFRAHLVGFRGIGNTMSSKFGGDGGPIEPAVVLRLGDGRKRCFPRGSFSEADKKYIMALYVKEMNRIKAGLDKTKRVKSPSADIQWPNNAKPGEPGTMQVQCEHFIWLSGSQAGSDGDPWVNEKEPEKAQWFRDGSIQCAEYWWAINEYAGHLMPHWDNEQQFKYWITVPGTKRDGFKVIPGYAGGGYGGCGIKGAGGGPWAMALFHEWGHGAMSNGWRIGGGEAQADAHQCLAGPVLKGNHHITSPWRNIFNGSMGYGYTMFYNIAGDDPNWGYNWFACLPSGAAEQSLMQMAARIGEQRGLFKNGIRGFGDMMGDYGARLATFDCELEDLFRRAYFAPDRSWLEPVDREKRVYRIPFEESPEPYGVNIVRLVADEAAGQIVVDFAGLHDGDFYSDWRACIVAVGADGKSRYSPMWNKGKMALKRLAGDRSYWLTVSATPTAIYSGDLAQAVYSGRYAYRYPWSVRLTGARPGTPRECRADFDDADLLFKAADSVPAPHDTAEGKRYLKKLVAFQKHLVKAEAGGAPLLLARIGGLKQKAQSEMDRMVKGARHANGGGWVARTATVAATAYVGPDAMVLAQAKVLDQAIIEDYAVVTGSAVVSGHARISGQAVVKGTAKAGGYSRMWGPLAGTDVATVVPKRLGAKTLNEAALWANYAMDRDEKTVLEDWYRFAHGADKRYGQRLGVNLNGYLYGRPEFVVDGERRGFRFDGKKQYAELCPRVADLGEITLDIALKWEGKGSQTIFDFGSSAGNCLVLRTDGNARCELVATVGGKAVATVAGSKALPAGQWVRLRVEIDGKRTSLWVAGKKVGEKATGFRPCDAFPGGEVKRNFLAASRDGSGGFKGVMDYIVVYHTVHEDFSKVPAPILDSPIRPTADFIVSLTEKYGNIAALNAKVGALSGKMLAPYMEMKKQCEARQKELLERDTGYRKAVADLASAKEAVENRKRELSEEFNKLPQHVKKQAEVDAARGKNDDLRRKVQALERERFEADEQLKALQARRKEAEDKHRSADKDVRTAFEKQVDVVEERAAIAERRKQADELRREVQKLEKEARQKDEKLTALYAKRDKYETDRVARYKVLEKEFKARPDVVEMDAQIEAARKRRHDSKLSKADRDKAGRQEDDLRRKWNEMWGKCRRSDSEHTGAERARNNLNGPIRERENAVRSEVHKNSAAARKYDGLEAKTRDRDRALNERLNKLRNSNEEYAGANAGRREIDSKIRDRQETLRDKLRASDPVAREQKKAEQKYRILERALRSKRDVHTAKGVADATRKVAEAEGALKEATAKAWLPYGPENAWLFSFEKQGYHGYYNTAYTHYIPGLAKAIVGGGEMREDLNILKALEKALSSEDDWHTSVDWDWRMRQEVDGRIKDLPLMQKWLKRVRGSE